MSKLRDENNRELVEEVRKGIPDIVREKVWRKLIIPPLKNYQSYVNQQELKEI